MSPNLEIFEPLYKLPNCVRCGWNIWLVTKLHDHSCSKCTIRFPISYSVLNTIRQRGLVLKMRPNLVLFPQQSVKFTIEVGEMSECPCYVFVSFTASESWLSWINEWMNFRITTYNQTSGILLKVLTGPLSTVWEVRACVSKYTEAKDNGLSTYVVLPWQ